MENGNLEPIAKLDRKRFKLVQLKLAEFYSRYTISRITVKFGIFVFVTISLFLVKIFVS